jgi:outer membrane protein assembly factor BamA
MFNVAGRETDLLGFRFWGDLAGAGAGAVDVPIYTDNFTVNLFWNSFDKAALESHRRGVKSNPKDRKFVVLDRFGLMLAQVNWRLLDRRLQFLAGVNEQQSKLGAIRNKDGELITEGNGEKSQEVSRSVGMFVDLTDDRSDPRRGGSFELYRYDRPSSSNFNADYYQLETNGLGYIPIGSFSTWAFNVYRAQAVVQRKGEIDREAIKQKLSFGCEGLADGPGRESCLKAEEEFVAEQRASNNYGTAPALGGTQRLRSYVTNRYYAAQTVAIGTEFRWNLTEEFTPFDIFVASGVRTGVQLALFAEGGTVADSTADLGKDWRHSAGGGVRFILASGFVVRLDVANGSEGTQPTLIFQYPWSVF